MNTFEIYEYGFHFATIEARTAESALRKAANLYPRLASDYNLDPGDTCETAWRACIHGGPWSASAKVPVPSRGSRRVVISGPAASYPRWDPEC
jgi:hypothetical protein